MARASFEESLAIAETPEAREGSSWAAWWLDDAATVFADRERAYLLYRRRGEAAAAARMATWLAADELDFRGGTAVANGWLGARTGCSTRSSRMPPTAGSPSTRATSRMRAATPTTARELGQRAAELGRRFDVADLEMLGLALEGSALVACARVTEGMRRLDEASAAALAGEAEIPISTAWACCFLVTACTAVLDLERPGPGATGSPTSPIATAAATCSRSAGRSTAPFTCGAARGQRRRRSSRRPSRTSRFAAGVGRSAARRARRSSAAARDGPPRRTALERTGGRRALLCRARLALDRGDTQRAGELAERLLRHIPTDRVLDRAPALEVLAHARITRGELDRAHRPSKALRDARRGSTPCRSERRSTWSRGVTPPRSPITPARTLLEDAVDGFDRSRLPFEAARARIELATLLVSSGRTDGAIAELGGAHGASSLSAQAGGGARERLLARLRRPGRGKAAPAVTPREREVLDLIAEASRTARSPSGSSSASTPSTAT